MSVCQKLRSPYPWFGGKSSIAPLVWERLGDVTNYVEPFFGSGAILLSRPHYPWQPPGTNRIETINDLDGFVPNFWRAIAADPESVATHADWPVSELDLHARHLWLTNTGRQLVEQLREDADWFDAKIAGWWVWGLCQWIGGGWCAHPAWQQRPHLGNAGRGIHRPSQKRPHLGNAGMGIHRPSQKLPHLGDAGRGKELLAYLTALSERMRGVRICCGDWSRVCGPTPTIKQGLTGIFLDPPYSIAERDSSLYAVEMETTQAVRQWCKEWGTVKQLRIVLCGYAGEGHEELEALGWQVQAWKARGGYASLGDGETTAGRDNAERERLWASPHCLSVDPLFDLLSQETP